MFSPTRAQANVSADDGLEHGDQLSDEPFPRRAFDARSSIKFFGINYKVADYGVTAKPTDRLRRARSRNIGRNC
jgi:hypothetical protein